MPRRTSSLRLVTRRARRVRLRARVRVPGGRACGRSGTPVPGPDDPPGAFSSTSHEGDRGSPAADAADTGGLDASSADTRRARGRRPDGSGRRQRPRVAPGDEATVEERPATTRASTSPPTSSAPSTTPRPVAAAVRPRASAAPRPKPARAGRAGAEGEGEADHAAPGAATAAAAATPRDAVASGWPSACSRSAARRRAAQARCSSPRRSCLPSPPAGAPCSAWRRGARRGRHDHVRALWSRWSSAGGCAPFPARLAALDPPSASCNGGGCGGWFRSNVSVSWSFNSSGATGVERMRRVDRDRGHVRRDVHVHRQLRRVVRREQRHRAGRTRRRLGDGSAHRAARTRTGGTRARSASTSRVTTVRPGSRRARRGRTAARTGATSRCPGRARTMRETPGRPRSRSSSTRRRRP